MHVHLLGSRSAQEEGYLLRLGRYAISDQQVVACRHLVNEAGAFTRHVLEGYLKGESRGTQALFELVDRFEAEVLGKKGGDPCSSMASCSGALMVDSERLALVDSAGAVDPGAILTGKQFDSFRRQRGRVRDLAGREGELAVKPCFMVDEGLREPLYRRLLDCGMAALIPEDDVDRRPDGRLFLNG